MVVTILSGILRHMCILLCVCIHAQLCPTLCNPMDCCPPGSYVHEILQARTLLWIAISFSRGSSWPRDLPDPGIEPTPPWETSLGLLASMVVHPGLRTMLGRVAGLCVCAQLLSHVWLIAASDCSSSVVSVKQLLALVVAVVTVVVVVVVIKRWPESTWEYIGLAPKIHLVHEYVVQ